MVSDWNPTEQVALIVGVVGFAGVALGALLGRRTAREHNAIEALKVLVSEQRSRLDKLQERVEKLEGERVILRNDLAREREYVRLLRSHIEARLPPPPPERP